MILDHPEALGHPKHAAPEGSNRILDLSIFFHYIDPSYNEILRTFYVMLFFIIGYLGDLKCAVHVYASFNKFAQILNYIRKLIMVIKGFYCTGLILRPYAHKVFNPVQIKEPTH